MTEFLPDDRDAGRTDEGDLLERARRLDEAALGAIFDAYYEPLYRYLYNHLGVSLTAEDLVADVFRNFLEQLNSRRGPTTNLRAWLFRVAHNLMVDELRRNKHREHESLDERQQAATPEIQDQVHQSMEQQVVQRALQRLTGKQRAVLVLKYLQGLETEEIAQALKMSIGTVKALQHRGLHAMRRYLKQAGILDETDP